VSSFKTAGAGGPNHAGLRFGRWQAFVFFVVFGFLISGFGLLSDFANSGFGFIFKAYGAPVRPPTTRWGKII
jgi:hypothetical protein